MVPGADRETGPPLSHFIVAGDSRESWQFGKLQLPESDACSYDQLARGVHWPAWRTTAVLRFVRAVFGDTESQLSMAGENWLVPEEKRNRRRALYWARRAARSSDPRASQLLKLILLDPRNSESAREAIFASFEAAAKAGDIAGQYSLGVCYEDGKGVPRNLEKALYWYTTAAAGGDRDAELAVARLCARQTE